MRDRSNAWTVLMAACVIAATGCSAGGTSAPSGGSSSPPPPPPAGASSVQVLPASFDFGRVTTSNNAAPLQVTIANAAAATAPLRVSNISFAAPAGQSFVLDPSGGSKPCASITPVIAAGDSCTVRVSFQPPGGGTFGATLQISSNDGTRPVVNVPIAGIAEGITSLTVRINQIDALACPNPLTTAYVSVTDQGGFPLSGLQIGDFSAAQGASNLPLTLIPPFNFIQAAYKNVAISAVLDNSGSLVDEAPVAFADMNAGFTTLVAGLKAGDIAEIIKFATQYAVVQSFTSDKAALTAAIGAPFNLGKTTLLYDTVFEAVNEVATRTTFRRAVVVATDGIDEGPTPGIPLSTNTVDTVIANAKSKNVPIFAIGIGAKVNSVDLEKMASQTGGLYYQASASQNLATIYQQLATLLFEKQYLLTFNRTATGAAAVQSPITVGARAIGAGTGTVNGSASRDVVVCP